ncbi:MAG: response regulator [Betaproteobacteria bacterium]|nr:response regulator [Betaproteobacteria bacterium]MBI3054549.1 response regulator [Betaproteobacteria bacterium]
MAENLTALVVDDEPDVCWALETLLLGDRFTVVTVGSGTEALRWLKESEPACHVILIDAKLSDIEGVDLARRIRTETSCVAPLILVSGYFYEDDSLVQDTLRSGLVSAFVAKPFRHDEILNAIHVVLSVEQATTHMASSP